MENHINLIAGFTGGVLGSLVAHPIDTIRVRYQTINYPSILETIKDTYKQGRLKAFYRGITFPLIGISFEKAIVFSSYNYFKNKNLSTNYFLNIALSGYITGLLTTTVMSPIEVLKTHYQYNLQPNFSLKSKLKTITNGYLATTLRESIGYSSYFLTYEFLEKYNPNKSLIPIYGGLCAVVSWSIIYPFDLIKNIKIIENTKSYATISKELYQHNGIKGFYRGFWLAQLRAIPYHSAVWTGYKLSKDFITNYQKPS